MKTLLFLFSFLLLVSCGEQSTEDSLLDSSPDLEKITPLEGAWVFEMNLGEAVLPFNVQLDLSNEKAPIVSIVNDEEIIEITDVVLRADSAFFRMPIFDSEFKAKVVSETELEGVWCNYIKGPDYKIPFTASWGDENRFEKSHKHNEQISGKWEVDFDINSEEPYKAIGNFTSNESHLFGTFITETGDYRYLDGAMDDNEIQLSCFDGSHAFLFKGTLQGDSIVNGTFWSGNHWETEWAGVRNENFELRDPYTITYLRDGYDQLDFSFPSLNGDSISLSDDKYLNKVVIVQIMGSWCPNCYDESALYTSLYERYSAEGLEIIALCYEKTEDFEEACKVVNKLKTHLNCNYDFLIAGKANKEEASASLPMLNEIISYPTSIIIDHSGKIRNIHTGFYGPGTGDYYTRHTEDFTMLIEKLLGEKEESAL